jgi:PAS domain S-box-containing protein
MAFAASAEPVGRANIKWTSDMAAAEHDRVGATLRAFDASEDWAIVLSLDGGMLATNASGRRVLGAEGHARFRGKKWPTLWESSHHAAAWEALSCALSGGSSKFFAERRDGAGKTISWEVAVWPVCDARDRATHLVAIARDVTERRTQEEAHALLAGELSHRIKNMFAVVDGVIALSSRVHGAARPFADTLRVRLREVGRAMAYVAPPAHGSGEADEPQARSLQGLLNILLQPYGGDSSKDQRIFISGDDLAINVGAITPLALVTNELATNAIKYGALSSASGRVDLNVQIEAERLRLSWRETLGDAVAGESGVHDPGDGAREAGFGTALLENAVVRQLKGALTREWSERGLTVMLEFPLIRVARDGV